MSGVAEHILGLPGWLALVLVFLLPALESSAFVGFLFPGEITLLLGGVLAYEHRISLAAVLAAGVGGAIVGDSVGYAIGRRWGRRILNGAIGRWVKHDHLERGERYLSERGGRAVFVGRFTAALRVMIPGLAGMARMPYRTFAVNNISSGLVWATMSILLGYLAGSSWRHVEHIASRVGLAVLAVVVVSFVGSRLLRRMPTPRNRRLARKLAQSTVARTARQRFPSQADWLKVRFTPGRSGLGLTALVVLGVGALWMFLGITQDVLAHEEVARFDPLVESFMLGHRPGWLTSLMRACEWLGSSVVLAPVLLLAAGWAFRRSGRLRPALNLVGVYVGAVLLNAVVAAFVHRDPPPTASAVVHAVRWSFPSGHTTHAVVALGALLLHVAAGRSARARTSMIAVAVLVVGLVATAGCYLGAYWFTDVAAGLVLGIAWLCGWLAVQRLVLPPPAAHRHAAQHRVHSMQSSVRLRKPETSDPSEDHLQSDGFRGSSDQADHG